MFSDNRTEIRGVFTRSWAKAGEGVPLEPLEALIVEVARQHPEYHALLGDPETALDRDYLPEQGQTNPFLHMGMHISIREQVQSDRPAGITLLYGQLVARTGDPHEAEHRLMECLGQMLWEAQRRGTPPDERDYLTCARRLIA